MWVINITRAYTNPINGEQSLAFCNKITLYDPETDSMEDAVIQFRMAVYGVATKEMTVDEAAAGYGSFSQ